MSGMFILNWIALGLQVTVPSYALRLCRLLGIHRVGWFLVAALASLACMRLIDSMAPVHSGFASEPTLNVVYSICSLLLLIGMGHIETVWGERLRAQREETRIRQEVELRVQEDTADLLQANQQLTLELARHERIEEALKKSEQQYALLFTDNPQAMWVFDLNSLRILGVNKAALRRYGYTESEFQVLEPFDLLPAGEMEAFFKAPVRINSGTESYGLWNHYKKDRSLMEVEVTAVDLIHSGSPARLVLLNDVTVTRRRDRETREAVKMEAVARAAGGVAHHFNNLLTIISGHTNLLLEQSKDSDAGEQLTRIATAAQRAAGLTRQLVAFAGCQMLDWKQVNLNAELEKLVPTLRRVSGEFITFEKTCAPNLPAIMGDSAVIQQIALNLVLNARDAMPFGGTLRISTAVVTIAERQAKRRLHARAGEFVRLCIRDTGCGMGPEIQSHLYEPFFTTKDVGKGTGLGLATVYGSVKQLSGWIEVRTEAGRGTEFRVYLPSIKKA